MTASDVIAFLALFVSAVSAFAAVYSVVVARKTMRTNNILANSNIIITLRQYWDNVPTIDLNNPDLDAITKAINAMDLTASLWIHGGVEKELLYQSFGLSYIKLCGKLSKPEIQVPGLANYPVNPITRPIHRVCQEMAQYYRDAQRQANLNP